MDEVFEGLKSLLTINSITPLVIAFGLLVLMGFLLSFGRRLESAMALEKFGIPTALVFGFFALCIGPYGPLPVLPESVTDIWIKLPTPLLTLVFASLMIGRPIPKGNGLLKPVASQALLGSLLGFGQYLVGGAVVLMILNPFFEVDPLMGCLIEVGFEGGHGAASIMGESFERFGFSGGLDLGLAMATIGLLSSTFIGSFLVVLGRVKGWIIIPKLQTNETKSQEEDSLTLWQQLSRLLINLSFAGSAVLIGVLLLICLRFFATFGSDLFREVIDVFPVFPLALLGSFLIRAFIEQVDQIEIVSPIIQREIGILATDLLITTAMASLNLPLLLNDWIPLTILAVCGLIWNLSGMFVFARLIFKDEWFERSLTEFGNATGVAASGLLLLRLADPRDNTNTLPIFSIKQLFLQPLLSGGLVTVIAPIVITRIGLLGWTEISGIITLILIILAFLFDKSLSENIN